MTARHTWALITGEYPPTPGGVADYTRALARALAGAGDDVHVWAPRAEGGAPLARDPGVEVHELAAGFGPRGLLRLERWRRRAPGAITLLEYTPHAFGLRAMNLPLCLWAVRGERTWVMFHEVHFPFRGLARQRALSLVQQAMARVLATSARRSFVSTAAWSRVLRRLAPGAPAPEVLAVPSNLPVSVAPEAVARLRAELHVGDEARIVGHFGTFGGWFRERLSPVLGPTLAGDDWHVLLVGRGANDVAAELRATNPSGASRVHAREGEAEKVAAAIAACDLLVQPYPDGPTTRRGSLMAALALGRPVVTNDGELTDDVFRSGAVALARDAAALAPEVTRLLGDAEALSTLGRAGAALYEASFSLERTVARLRAAAAEEAACASR